MGKDTDNFLMYANNFQKIVSTYNEVFAGIADLRNYGFSDSRNFWVNKSTRLWLWLRLTTDNGGTESKEGRETRESNENTLNINQKNYLYPSIPSIPFNLRSDSKAQTANSRKACLIFFRQFIKIASQVIYGIFRSCLLSFRSTLESK